MRGWKKHFYGSVQWQAVREYVKRRDQMLCQDCLKKGIYTPAEEVHHITPLTAHNYEDPEIALNAENLVSLCKECHRARHEGDKTSRRWTVDEYGHVQSRF